MKPKIIKDLLSSGHITIGDTKNIARSIFDGHNTAEGTGQGGLEGYVITACKFDELAEHIQGFIIKAILEFQVQNFLDVKTEADSIADDDGMVIADSKPRGYYKDSMGRMVRRKPRKEKTGRSTTITKTSL